MTGNTKTGIRDYALDANPLNYSDVGFDLTGPEVHADGEIWNAVNYDLRQALVKKYDAHVPVRRRARCSCAAPTAGRARPRPRRRCRADQCPGNRRWIQIVFDAFLLQQGDTSMLTARDAYLAADRMRFGGANQAELWNAFAKRGMGESALDGHDRGRPADAGFDSPLADERDGDVRRPGRRRGATVYIGRYEARATPVADTDPATALGATVKLVPGTYDVLVRAPGYGLRRFTLTVDGRPGADADLHADAERGVQEPGRVGRRRGHEPRRPDRRHRVDDVGRHRRDRRQRRASPSVTISFAGAKPVRSIAVSALLDPDDPDADEGRFTALRRFKVETCDGRRRTARCRRAGSRSTRARPTRSRRSRRGRWRRT